MGGTEDIGRVYLRRASLSPGGAAPAAVAKSPLSFPGFEESRLAQSLRRGGAMMGQRNQSPVMAEPSHKPGCTGTRLFLDTEWANEAATDLVSLALVDESGAQQFYAEVDPLPASATDFVRFVVYPLLERGWAAMQRADLSTELKGFLARFDRPIVVFDHPNDGSLLARALAHIPADKSVSTGGLYQCQLVSNASLQPFFEAYFDRNPASARLRHRADIDAQALRWAVLRQEHGD